MSALGPFFLFSGGSFDTLCNLFGARISHVHNPQADGPTAANNPRGERSADDPMPEAAVAPGLARRMLSLVSVRRRVAKSCVITTPESSLGGTS